MENNIEKTVNSALDSAKRHGADNARVTYSKSSETSYSYIGQKLDRLNRATTSSLFIQIYANGRYGAFSTNRLDGNEIDKLIKDGIETTRLLAEDRAYALPAKERYFRDNGQCIDLEQYDSNIKNISEDAKKQLALDAAAEIEGKDNRLIFVSSDYSDYEDYVYMADTQGFCGDGSQTSFNLSCECSVKGKDDARPEAWWYESALYFDRLIKNGCGTKALERALAKLNPKKIKTGKYTAVIEYRVASRLLGPVINALNGSALQAHNSFLQDSLGKKIFSDRMTLTDRPFEPGLPGSRYFDSEGVATYDNDIIKNGTVNTYHITTYYANKLGITPTIDTLSNLRMESSSPDGYRDSTAEMMKSAGTGILVTGFNGGNCNQGTGDFSFGIEGFYFENGVIMHPVSEMNMTGNMKILWNNLVYMGKDEKATSSWLIPSLTFSDVEFSGI